MTPHRYSIRLSGGLGPAAREAFEGFEIRSREGNTELIGVLDQAALFGVLLRLQALSLELISVHRED